VCGYVADEDVESFRGVYVISRPNKDEFEPTSGPSVSGMACVGSCPTLLVEGEPHQHILGGACVRTWVASSVARACAWRLCACSKSWRRECVVCLPRMELESRVC
jgi:hypothetical protein